VSRLFWKIFLAFWLALAAAAAATGTAVWLHRYAREAGERDLLAGPPQAFSTALAAATLHHGGVDALRAWIAEASHARPLAMLAVDDAGRDLLGRPVPAASLARAKALAAQGTEPRAARLVTAAGGERILLFTPPGAEPRRRAPPPVSPWLQIAIGTVASLAVSAVLAWYLVRPIRSLRWAFDGVARGRLDTRVRPLIGKRRDEIADLGSDFDRMAQQLQALVSAQRRLLHDVSHELRSPLARLHAAIGLARQDPRNLEHSLGRIEREATRLDEMVGQVLTLARLESGADDSAHERFDLGEMVGEVVEDARFEARAAGKDVHLQSAGPAPVSGRPELLHRAIENVVRNAVRFSPEGAAVEVTLHLDPAAACALVSVTDRGPGVATDELERIFEPFYRADGNDSKSFGLGLAIAERAVNAHGGVIRAENAPGAGLRVVISLPLA